MLLIDGDYAGTIENYIGTMPQLCGNYAATIGSAPVVAVSARRRVPSIVGAVAGPAGVHSLAGAAGGGVSLSAMLLDGNMR